MTIVEIDIDPSAAGGKQFDDHITNGACLARFHRPECVHCEALANIWKSIVQHKVVDEIGPKILNVHSDTLPHIKNKCTKSIMGVPTLMIIPNNTDREIVYNGENTTDNIIDFIRKNKRIFLQNGGGGKARRSKARRSKARRSKARRSKARRSKARRSKARKSRQRRTRSKARKSRQRRTRSKARRSRQRRTRSKARKSRQRRN